MACISGFIVLHTVYGNVDMLESMTLQWGTSRID
jgi:hypothetical protein